MYNFGNLQGVRVVSAGTVIGAPFACSLFAEHGAEVIHIESVLSKDLLRNFKSAWAQEHRNQKGMSLNIPCAEGKEILARLLKTADMLVESSKGGTWKKWGLSDEELWKINPALVIVHVSGYGQEGDPEYITRASYDSAGQAFSGFLLLNGMPDPNPPLLGKPYLCDYITALTAAWGALVALYRAKQTGKGESVDVAQYEAMLKIESYNPLEGLTYGAPQKRLGNPDPLIATDLIYQCKGGYIYIGMTGIGPLTKGLKLIGLADDPDFIPVPKMVSRENKPVAEKFLNAMRSFCMKYTADELDQMLNKEQIPCAKAMTYEDMATHPHYLARESIMEWEDTERGKVRGVGIVPKFKNNPGKIVKASPLYGEDNEAILKELGYSNQEIQSFYSKEVIKRNK